MDRRDFLGLTAGAMGIVTGGVVEARDDTIWNEQTTSELQETCYDPDRDKEYKCHNYDEDSEGTDAFYVKAWTGDASNREEIDFTNDFGIYYQFYYNGYGSHGVRGHVEPNRSLEALEVIATSYTFDEDLDEHILVDQARDYLGDVNADLKHPYDVSMYTSWRGDYSVFELWVMQAY